MTAWTAQALAPRLMPTVKEGVATLRDAEHRRANVCKFLVSLKNERDLTAVEARLAADGNAGSPDTAKSSLLL